MDRVRATRLAVKCMQWLEDPSVREGCTSAVIGIRGGNVVFSNSETLEVQETDFETRRSKVVWWSGLKKVSATLSTSPSPLISLAIVFADSVGWGSDGRWS
jgi:6-phosphofructokinase 1